MTSKCTLVDYLQCNANMCSEHLVQIHCLRGYEDWMWMCVTFFLIPGILCGMNLPLMPGIILKTYWTYGQRSSPLWGTRGITWLTDNQNLKLIPNALDVCYSGSDISMWNTYWRRWEIHGWRPIIHVLTARGVCLQCDEFELYVVCKATYCQRDVGFCNSVLVM